MQCVEHALKPAPPLEPSRAPGHWASPTKIQYSQRNSGSGDHPAKGVACDAVPPNPRRSRGDGLDRAHVEVQPVEGGLPCRLEQVARGWLPFDQRLDGVDPGTFSDADQLRNRELNTPLERVWASLPTRNGFGGYSQAPPEHPAGSTQERSPGRFSALLAQSAATRLRSTRATRPSTEAMGTAPRSSPHAAGQNVAAAHRRFSLLSESGCFTGGSTGIRTLDLWIKNPQLYRLSYRPAGWAFYSNDTPRTTRTRRTYGKVSRAAAIGTPRGPRRVSTRLLALNRASLLRRKAQNRRTRAASA